MIKLTSKLLLGVVLFALFVPGVFADELYLQSGGAGYDGYSVAPYTAVLNGVTTLQVICDDFDTQTYVGQQHEWGVVATNVASLSTTVVNQDVKFVNAPGDSAADQAEAYMVVADLAIGLMNATTTYDRAMYNYAIWGIFSNNAVPSLSKQVDRDTVTALINGAMAKNKNLSDYAHVTIWTSTTDDKSPQEFISVAVPEPAVIAMILFDLLALGGFLLFVRQRKARSLS